MKRIFLKFAFVMALAGGVAGASSILYSNSNLPTKTGINNTKEILNVGEKSEKEATVDISSLITAKTTNITKSNVAYTFSFSMQFTGRMPVVSGTTDPDLVNYDNIYAVGYRDSNQISVNEEDEIKPYVEITTENGVFKGEINKVGNNNADFVGIAGTDFSPEISTSATVVATGSILSARIINFIRCRYNRTTEPKDPLPVPKVGSEYSDVERELAYATLKTSTGKYYDLNGTFDDTGKVVTPKLLEAKLSSISKFNGIVSINSKLSTYFVSNYLTFLKTNIKDSVKADIASGKFAIGSKFNAAVSGNLIVKTDKGTYLFPSSSYASYFVDGSMNLNLVADLKSQSIEGEITELYATGLSISTYVYQINESAKQVPQLGTSVYFNISLLDLNPTKEKTNTISFDLIVALIVVALVAIVAGLSVLNYFRAKKAGEGKEFGEVNKSEFIKTSIMSELAVVSVALFLLSVLVRITFMNNTFAVYNPLDIFIISTAITSIILVGYFIRYFMIVIKNYRAKKKADAMKTAKKEYYF